MSPLLSTVQLASTVTYYGTRNYVCWYSEHLRLFKLTSSDNFSVLQPPDLNDTEMASQNFIFHLHTSTDIVRKMTLSSRPESVDELKTMIKERFKLDFDFSLSYQDPDFDGQLCSLVDSEELLQKVVLKVIRPESDASSVASDDTITLPHAMTPDRTEGWHHVFPVPTFSYEVELILDLWRTTNINLKNHFYAALGRHSPRPQSLFRMKASRTGKVSEVLGHLFMMYVLQVTQSDEPDINDMSVVLLSISACSTDTTFFCPERTAVVLEGINSAI
ncbi:hypothetical protein NFI96_006061 [Prochilodus magdalenae]|nr:hypothetical protein NFI96_006061 [Prochilodus magdalenae]